MAPVDLSSNRSGALSRASTGLGGDNTLAAVLRAVLHWHILRVVGRRLLVSVPLLFVVSSLTFVLVSLTPGDAAHQILGSQAPPEAYQKLRHALGLDLPLYEQYWRWLKNVFEGDLGASLFTEERVTHAINGRLPVTLSLIVGAILVSVTVGILLGVLSALRGGVIGRAVDAFSLVGFALPEMWLAAQLIVLFAVILRWFPATGYVTLSESPLEWLRSITLPVIALSVGGVAAIAKQTREAMLDVLGSEHIRMAWANGIPRRSVVFRHALKNAAVPVVTLGGLQAVSLLGGTVIVENVFGLPGLGWLAVNAVIRHDLPMIQGIIVYFTVMVILINLIIDLTYSWLNPRIRTS
jgi:peptide/nickel transport system permease protein